MWKILRISVAIFAVTASNAPSQSIAIPIEKGNTWVYTYCKVDSAPNIPGYSIFHDSLSNGSILISIDSLKKALGPKDSTFFRIVLIDSGTSRKVIWDSLNSKYDTFFATYKKKCAIKYYLFNDSIFSIDSNNIATSIMFNRIYNKDIIPASLLFYEGVQNTPPSPPSQSYTQIRTDSAHIAIGGRPYTDYSTITYLFDSHSVFSSNTFDTVVWVPQIGTLDWSYRNAFNRGGPIPYGQITTILYSLQSFNGITIPLIPLSVIQNIKSPTLAAHRAVSYQGSLYLNFNRMNRDHRINPLGVYISLRGQKTAGERGSQLLVFIK
jgi:hypothetical protein